MSAEQATAGETCRCGRAMVNTTVYIDEGMLRWRCPHCREVRHRPAPSDALADALARVSALEGENKRLQDALEGARQAYHAQVSRNEPHGDMGSYRPT